jgi:hypothetical protein
VSSARRERLLPGPPHGDAQRLPYRLPPVTAVSRIIPPRQRSGHTCATHLFPGGCSGVRFTNGAIERAVSLSQQERTLTLPPKDLPPACHCAGVREMVAFSPPRGSCSDPGQSLPHSVERESATITATAIGFHLASLGLRPRPKLALTPRNASLTLALTPVGTSLKVALTSVGTTIKVARRLCLQAREGCVLPVQPLSQGCVRFPGHLHPSNHPCRPLLTPPRPVFGRGGKGVRARLTPSLPPSPVIP